MAQRISQTLFSGTRAATFSQSPLTGGNGGGPILTYGADFEQLIVTLNVTAAERDSADETYDIWVTTSDGIAVWDLVHFPQIATTGAKTFTARIIRNGGIPQTVTTAGPGVAVNDSGTLAVHSGATNAAKSLAAGIVRHGPWGDYFGHELTVAGTVVTGISYTIQISGA